MVILTVNEYQQIVASIRAFDGLWIECGKFIVHTFSHVDPDVLTSILQREGQARIRQTHSSVSRDIKRILRDFNKRLKISSTDDVLLRMASEMKFSPISLSRLLLAEKYPEQEKKEISEMVKNPNLIPDLTLALNIYKCQLNDNLDGPVTDNIRRFVGEEYEVLVSIVLRIPWSKPRYQSNSPNFS